MTLTTAHKILIATAVVFFLGFTFWSLRRYVQVGDVSTLLLAIASLAAAVALGFYLRSFVRSLK